MIKTLKKILKNILLDQEYVGTDSKTLNGKVVIVTGATGGIGKAIVEVLLKQGVLVVGASNANKMTDIKVDNYIEIKTDITDSSEVQKLFKTTVEKYKRVDAVINNAGLFSYGQIESITEAEFESVVSVNVTGAFLMAKFAVPIMKNQRSGTIINIGSKISRNTRVEPKKSLYALTKHAIEGFSFALNRELRPFGIRVVCLMPGTVNTFFSRKYKNFMSPYDVAEVINMILKMDQIDFESVVFKSKRQDI